MDALTKDLAMICRRNPQGSIATRANRLEGLKLIAAELKELGFKLPSARSIKPKHPEKLIQHWKGKGLADTTIANRLSWFRWWGEQVNKAGIFHRENEDYGLAPRTIDNGNKAQKLDLEKLGKITCPHVRMSLRLQAAFGLRREEAMKFQPKLADKGEYIGLKPSWTKGGRYREIPITTPRQRALLNEAAELAGQGSLIPDGKTYVQHLKSYERLTIQAGLKNNHGLRHNYAQWRYQALTGQPCAAAGGLTRASMTAEQWQADRAARWEISSELGHGRIDIVDAYLGRATK